jgi:exopolysaccharide biosynthesis polyprenyl glycosylphosphotransferase
MTSNANISIQATMRIVPKIYPSQATCKRIYQVALIASDTAMILFAFVIAYWLRFILRISVAAEVQPKLEEYITLAFLLVPVWLGLFWLLRLYDLNCLLGGTGEYTRAVNACTSGMMLVVIAIFLNPSFIIARGWLVMAWLLSCLFVCSARLLLRRLAYMLRRQGYFVSPVLIIGTNSEATSLAAQLQNSIHSGMVVVGFVSEKDNEPRPYGLATLAGLPIVGSLASLPETIQRQGIEEVILATTALTHEQRLDTVLRLAEMPNLKMSISSGLYEIFTTGMRVTTRNSVPLLNMNRIRLDLIEMTLKTALDYTLILLAAPALLLLFLVIGLLIKLDSKGPVVYRRRVLGVGGKEFDALKFRTMVVNGDEVLAQYPEKQAELRATHKLKDDPRITRMGRLLRKTSLDELPQLINVILGQMSLVGPRMIHPDEGAMYGLYRSNLLTVKPGLTGLWQVSGRSDIGYDERIQLDMHYIRNYSIWMDLQILFFQTLPAVFAKRGAY